MSGKGKRAPGRVSIYFNGKRKTRLIPKNKKYKYTPATFKPFLELGKDKG